MVFQPQQQTVHQEEVHVAFLRDRRGPCSWILNFLWLVIAGWHMFLTWFIVGIILCTCNCCANILWIVTVGWFLSIQAVGTGIVFCLSCIGIPFGWQCFKLAYICLWPFGADVSANEIQTVTVINTTAANTQYTRLEEGGGGGYGTAK
jgi:uncharacterized membrane protein YccF (DUF307 family)